MPVTLDHADGVCQVHLEGEINIASAQELKSVLLQALNSSAEVRVDLERVTELDITALQLLWAAEHKATGLDTRLVLAGRLPETLAESAVQAGFEMFPIPADEGGSSGV